MTNAEFIRAIRTKAVNWNMGHIQRLLMGSRVACRRALIVLYNRQTIEERDSGTAKFINGVGFNKYDAAKFKPIIDDLIADHRELTDQEWAEVRKPLCKYWRQLQYEIRGDK